MTKLINKSLIWHPFTQEKTDNLPLVITRGKGSYIYDENNNKYLDLISSWWVNLHGHANKEIAQSIYNQALTLEHVIFAGFTHNPARVLCENLSKYLPKKLCKFFFSDNGSTSVEIALKMAYQYWKNQGYEKKLFLCFEGGYHGDTFGAMSVGSSGFHNAFTELLFNKLIIPYPETWENDNNIQQKEQEALKVLEDYFKKYNNKIAAIILEPLIQGASGMRMCRHSFIKTLINKITKHNILVIFDEVMTGFGRTGTLFALNQLNIVPDFLCLSKGITGGFLPLALTITTKKIYSAFWHNEWRYAFAHGHSYTANPLACQAAVTSLELTIKVLNNGVIKKIENEHIKGLSFLKDKCKNISKIRNLGTIIAFNINDKKVTPLTKLKQAFLKQGLLIRPLKNSIYIIPPYTITTKELEESYIKIINIINKYI